MIRSLRLAFHNHRFAFVLLLGWLLFASPAGVSPIHAQAGNHETNQEGNQAGLVVVHGDGSVSMRCVAFAEAQISGEELLRRSGIAILSEPTAMGMSVCSLDGEGCNFPAEGCFCQCQGGACTYWSYWLRPTGSAWSYSNQGATSSVILPGTVAGWRWGVADAGQASTLPEVAINQICAAPTATPSATSTDTPTYTPTFTPTSTPSDTPTWTPSETPTQTPTETPTTTPTPTFWDTPTPYPTPTFTFTPVPSPTPTHTQPAPVAVAADTPAPPSATPEPTSTAPPPAAVTPLPLDTHAASAGLPASASADHESRVWLPAVAHPQPLPTPPQPVPTVTLPPPTPEIPVQQTPSVAAFAPAPESPLVAASGAGEPSALSPNAAYPAQATVASTRGETGFALLALTIAALAGAAISLFIALFVWIVVRWSGD